ncbi:MAG: hypothetical protein VX589_01445 [Myxococcota bacterium]|nr:hypothetical protein [Myxococcota bacterium]
MTFQVNHQRPLSGNRRFLWGVLATFIAGGVAHSAPFVQRLPGGEINWSSGTIEVVGVGTPTILSASGAVSQGDLIQQAARNGQQKMRAILRAICPRLFDGGQQQNGDYDNCVNSAETSLIGRLRQFSDGSIHRRQTLLFSKLLSHYRARAPQRGEPTGESGELERSAPGSVTPARARLRIIVDEPLPPVLFMKLRVGGGPTYEMGLPNSQLGRLGLRWLAGADEQSRTVDQAQQAFTVRGRRVEGSHADVAMVAVDLSVKDLARIDPDAKVVVILRKPRR